MACRSTAGRSAAPCRSRTAAATSPVSRGPTDLANAGVAQNDVASVAVLRREVAWRRDHPDEAEAERHPPAGGAEERDAQPVPRCDVQRLRGGELKFGLIGPAGIGGPPGQQLPVPERAGNPAVRRRVESSTAGAITLYAVSGAASMTWGTRSCPAATSASGAALQAISDGYAASVRRAPAATAMTMPPARPARTASTSQDRHRARSPVRTTSQTAATSPHLAPDS